MRTVEFYLADMLSLCSYLPFLTLILLFHPNGEKSNVMLRALLSCSLSLLMNGRVPKRGGCASNNGSLHWIRGSMHTLRRFSAVTHIIVEKSAIDNCFGLTKYVWPEEV